MGQQNLTMFGYCVTKSMNNKLPKALVHCLLTLSSLSYCTTFFPLLATRAAGQHPVSVNALRVEYMTNPVGIDSPNPRFSWQLQDDRRGTVQTSYQVQVARTERELRASRLVWDS